MSRSCSEIKLFQVKTDQLDAFEALVRAIQAEQERLPGCLSVRYMKRFYTVDGVENGKPPRELTKIVKCVKYFPIWNLTPLNTTGRPAAGFSTGMPKG